MKVQKKTRDRLAEFGNKSETFDDVINRLMDFYEKIQGNLTGNLADGRRQGRTVR